MKNKLPPQATALYDLTDRPFCPILGGIAAHCKSIGRPCSLAFIYEDTEQSKYDCELHIFYRNRRYIVTIENNGEAHVMPTMSNGGNYMRLVSDRWLVDLNLPDSLDLIISSIKTYGCRYLLSNRMDRLHTMV